MGKCYYVHLKHELSDDDIKALCAGVRLNGETKDTKVVKVSEVVYDNTGKSTEKPINSPYVVKVTGSDVEVLRGPKKTPQSADKITNQASNFIPIRS